MAGVPSRFLLSPHKLVMCILLNAVGAPRASSSTNLVALSNYSRHKLALLLLEFFKSSGSLLEPSYEELERNLESSLGAGSAFSEELRNLLLSISSVEDLFNLFLSLRDLLALGQQSRATLAINRLGDGDQLTVELSSTLGLFLRRCILSFNELSFEGTCRLLRELQNYCELVALATEVPTAPPESPLTRYFQEHQFLEEEEQEDPGSFLRRRGDGNEERLMLGAGKTKSPVEAMDIQDGHGKSAMEVLGGSSGGKGGGSGTGKRRYFLRTSAEVEAYLSEQAVMVEKNRSFQKMFADGFVAKLCELKELAFHIPQVHYLQYLNCLFEKDYPAAMESLHRYFDFSAGEVSVPGSTTHYDSSGIGRLQAGLLGLGQMHSHMGHITMALQALNESILIAQQNNDNGCLLHALAALCNLFTEVGMCTDDDERCQWIAQPGLDPEYKFSPAPEQHIVGLLKRCLCRALELKLPQLIGFSRLAIAKIKLQHVHKMGVVVRMRNSSQFGTSPVEVCRILRITGSLLGNFESGTFRINSANSHGRNPHSDTANNIGPGSGISSALGASGWGWWKPNGKLGVLARSLLKLGGTSQLLRAASWEHYGCEPLVRASVLVHISCYADAASADDLSLAYIKLVKLLTSLKGHSASQDSLALVGKRFPLLSKSRVRAVQVQSRIEWSLLQGEHDLARMACGELLATASVVSGVDMALKIQASSYKVQIHLGVCQYQEAAVSANKLFSLCFKSNMQQDSIEMLLLMAEIYKKAGNAVTGLPYVLAALTLCQSLNLDLLQASAIITLAELWLGMGVLPGQRPLVLLQQCMPVVLGHGSLQLRARANLAIAQCYLSDPSFSVQTDPDAVLEPLKVAAQHAQMMEDVSLAMECLYLQAVVLDALGRVAERDEAALSFQRCMLRTQMDLPLR
ncbi:unnamed protein product [Calypogeia fissa]